MKFLTVVRESAWARAGLLLVVIAISVWIFGFTPRERATIGMAAAWHLGVVVPALILGAAWGWIWFSRSHWGWATAVLLVLTFVVVYYGTPLNDYYKELGTRGSQSAGVPIPDAAKPDFSDIRPASRK
ncbi:MULTISPECIES: hypothetical protein [unclassified Bradyrhizobium]|uniref:hypothetical protein n=1 Tax=unclassified Bradyrhizobium TaxID=2631580 RepID=UPI003395F472